MLITGSDPDHEEGMKNEREPNQRKGSDSE